MFLMEFEQQPASVCASMSEYGPHILSSQMSKLTYDMRPTKGQVVPTGGHRARCSNATGNSDTTVT